jgi:flagellum-specific ATP synthase
MSLDWADLEDRLRLADPGRAVGRVANLVGMIVEVADLGAPVGSLCRIETGRQGAPVLCEVVGFRDDRLLVMPYQEARGIAPGCRATILASHLTVPVGPALLGRVVDGLGRPLDGGPGLGSLPRVKLGGTPPSAMHRRRVTDAVSTGIRSIDSMITTARGQRMGIFAGSGVGKSVLMGMLARQARVDVNVLALIGERGREVREFIERDLGPEGLARSVVVVVTSDESAVMRAKGADTAMTIAEQFRDSDHEVLFMMDSATRYAMALREIGLAAGEPPTTKGYPPSTFAALPRLCERAGWSEVNAMTAFFTVLIEGDDIHDPVGDAMRSILDGHVMLSRDLARQHHYPAVDVLGSVSRLRSDIVEAPDREAGARLMQWLKTLEDNRDLVNIGAYVAGADPVLDEALAREKDIRAFLKQDVLESTNVEASLAGLRQLTGIKAPAAAAPAATSPAAKPAAAKPVPARPTAARLTAPGTRTSGTA